MRVGTKTTNPLPTKYLALSEKRTRPSAAFSARVGGRPWLRMRKGDAIFVESRKIVKTISWRTARPCASLAATGSRTISSMVLAMAAPLTQDAARMQSADHAAPFNDRAFGLVMAAFPVDGAALGVAAGGALMGEELVDEGDRHAALADRRCDPLHRAQAHIAAGEDAGRARLEEVRIAGLRPSPHLLQIIACEHISPRVARDLSGQPPRLGIGADENENAAAIVPAELACLAVAEIDRGQMRLAMHRLD